MTKSVSNSIRSVSSVAGIAALALFAVQPAHADDHEDSDAAELTKGEERLAKLLEGRVAGEPQNCIRSRLNDRVTVIDDTAIVYGRGRTIYLQRTKHPERIDNRDALVSRRFNGSQICRLDIVNTVDPVSGIFTGAVFFEDFIPYTRVEETDG